MLYKEPGELHCHWKKSFSNALYAMLIIMQFLSTALSFMTKHCSLLTKLINTQRFHSRFSYLLNFFALAPSSETFWGGIFMFSNPEASKAALPSLKAFFSVLLDGIDFLYFVLLLNLFEDLKSTFHLAREGIVFLRVLFISFKLSLILFIISALIQH